MVWSLVSKLVDTRSHCSQQQDLRPIAFPQFVPNHARRYFRGRSLICGRDWHDIKAPRLKNAGEILNAADLMSFTTIRCSRS